MFWLFYFLVYICIHLHSLFIYFGQNTANKEAVFFFYLKINFSISETFLSLRKQIIMQYEFDSQEFSKRVKTKRLIELNLGLREVSKKSKVSISTLSRVENGFVPDMGTLIKISNWLKTPPSVFFVIKK